MAHDTDSRSFRKGFWFIRYQEDSVHLQQDKQEPPLLAMPVQIATEGSETASIIKAFSWAVHNRYLCVLSAKPSELLVLEGLPHKSIKRYDLFPSNISRIRRYDNAIYWIKWPGPVLTEVSFSFASPPPDLSRSRDFQLPEPLTNADPEKLDFCVSLPANNKKPSDVFFFIRGERHLWRFDLQSKTRGISRDLGESLHLEQKGILSIDRVVSYGENTLFVSDSHSGKVATIERSSTVTIVYDNSNRPARHREISNFTRPCGLLVFRGSIGRPKDAYVDNLLELHDGTTKVRRSLKNVANKVAESVVLLVKDAVSGHVCTFNPLVSDLSSTILTLLGNVIESDSSLHLPPELLNYGDYTDIDQGEDYRLVIWGERTNRVILIDPQFLFRKSLVDGLSQSEIRNLRYEAT